MKYNLKERVRMPTSWRKTGEYTGLERNYEEWFEGFEKEIQGQLNYLVSDLGEEETALNPDQQWIRCLKLRIKLLKRILGESE